MKNFFFITIVLQSFLSIAQNLVQNPSFETYSNCPNASSEITNSMYWSNFEGSPDYFNSCSGNFGVPSNLMGFQAPHSGNAYCGIIMNEHKKYWEAAANQLLQPLTIGQKYYISFYTTLAINSNNCYACNMIGAKFLNANYYNYYVSNVPQSNPIAINSAQVYCNNIITDTTNWVQITGSFVADSAYQYIAVGNFFDSTYINIIQVSNGGLPLTAYYYIDDVCVSTDSVYANTWATSIKNFSNVNAVVLNQNQPNPFAEQTIITYSIPQTANNAQILFYDTNGSLINTVNITSKGNGQLNVYANDLTNGTYSYTLVIDGNIVATKKMIKTQ